MTERDEEALRQALQQLGGDEPVDLGQVRRRAAERRRNRRAVAGLAVVLVLVAGVVGLPRLLAGGGESPTSAAGGAEAGSAPEADTRSGDFGGPGDEPSDAGQPEAEQPEAEPADGDPRAGRVAPPPTDPAPPGWRTEYFRDISFQVPADWGYAVPPQSDWCAEGRDKVRADQRRPYVWLAGSVYVLRIGCPAIPTSLLTEHVEALAPGPATDDVEGAVRQGDWWVVTRFAGSAVLVVTSKDLARAERILDSAQVAPKDAPCAPRSPIAGPLGARPDNGLDLRAVRPVDGVVLCQYQPAPDPADADLPSLRAAVRLAPKAGRALVDRLAAAPVNDRRCERAPVQSQPDLAVLVRITVAGTVREAYVNPAGCPTGGGMAGGIDDGTTVRVLTRPACSRLLTPPLAVWSAVGDVRRSCQG
jgi:hypothetical protein